MFQLKWQFYIGESCHHLAKVIFGFKKRAKLIVISFTILLTNIYIKSFIYFKSEKNTSIYSKKSRYFNLENN